MILKKCQDCGKNLNKYAHKNKNTRCSSCASKERIRKNGHPSYIDGRTNKTYFCKTCLKQIAMTTALYGTGYCQKCVKVITTPKLIKTLKRLGRSKGKNNPNYIHGLRLTPYSYSFTKSLKKQIFERDKYTCQKCHIYPCNDLTCHHIDYDKKNSIKKNLITLCRKCNSFVNFNRDYWFAYFRYIMENYVYQGT